MVSLSVNIHHHTSTLPPLTQHRTASATYPIMHLAALLSDLTALRASDPDAALALVRTAIPSDPTADPLLAIPSNATGSAQTTTTTSAARSTATEMDTAAPNPSDRPESSALTRARRLTSLHREFRGGHGSEGEGRQRGGQQGGQVVRQRLEEARRMVEGAGVGGESR